jgi:ABC-type Fe3+/spermidine/putrescine transport system ATPase subunit
MSAVKLDNVSKRFGKVLAADRVSFEVRAGEFLTLLGPSGCGKTTLLRIIAGFLRSSEGQVRIGDRVVNHLPPHVRSVGLVFQSYALFPHMTVRDNIAFGLKMRNVARKESDERLAEILDLVQLSDRAGYFPAQLSGGQQQRVALARALVTRPTVLLLDEPFSALDRHIGELLRAELKRVQRRLSISTILVTHAQDEALMLSDRIAVMNHGRIEQIGAPEQLYERPCSRFVAEFLGRSNLVRIQQLESSTRIIGSAETDATAPGESGGEVRIAIVRPENVLLHPPSSAAQFGRYSGTVEDVQYLGHTRTIRIRLDVGVAIEAIALGGNQLKPAVGSKVDVEVPRESFHVIGNVASLN